MLDINRDYNDCMATLYADMIVHRTNPLGFVSFTIDKVQDVEKLQNIPTQWEEWLWLGNPCNAEAKNRWNTCLQINPDCPTLMGGDMPVLNVGYCADHWARMAAGTTNDVVCCDHGFNNVWKCVQGTNGPMEVIGCTQTCSTTTTTTTLP